MQDAAVISKCSGGKGSVYVVTGNTENEKNCSSQGKDKEIHYQPIVGALSLKVFEGACP